MLLKQLPVVKKTLNLTDMFDYTLYIFITETQ